MKGTIIEDTDRRYRSRRKRVAYSLASSSILEDTTMIQWSTQLHTQRRGPSRISALHTDERGNRTPLPFLFLFFQGPTQSRVAVKGPVPRAGPAKNNGK